jgi:hypothetical protein
MKLLRDNRGQTTWLMGLCIMSLVGMSGLAVDAGMMFRAKRVLQAAADAGAIAGAAEVQYADVTSAAKAATAMNGVTDGSSGTTVTVHNPPSSGPYAGNSGYVEVLVTQAEPTFFMKIFHLSSMNVGARAVAGLGAGGGCIYTLDPSGTDIGMTGSGELDMPDCAILVNSAASNAVNLTGTTNITAKSIGIVGGYNTTGSATVIPSPIQGIAPAANPLAFETPPTFNASSCLANPSISGSGTTQLGNPGGGTTCYNGISASGSGTVNFYPGLYIINGAFKCTGSTNFSGSGVTFYLAPPNGSLTLTGSGILTFSAPTSGTYNGLLFFEDATDTNAMKISGSGSSNLQGIFYAPSASMTMTGSSTATFYTDLVVQALSMTGTTNLSSYADVNASDPITRPRMVE